MKLFYVRLHNSNNDWLAVDADSELEAVEIFAEDTSLMKTSKVEVQDHGVFTVHVDLHPEYYVTR